MARPTVPVPPILVVDDEEQTLLSVELTLTSHGLKNIQTCRDSRLVLERLEQQPHALVILDINMPFISGVDLLPDIVNRHPGLPVIMVTAVSDIASVVHCMREGAFDYVVKPVDEMRLVSVVKRGLEMSEIRSENEMLKQSFLRESIEHPEAFRDLITRSGKMQSVFRYVEAIAPTNLPVLITGETGTGKELLARAVHEVSGRKGALVAVNVAGVDDTFFSDTLFGHRKGAFTGADMERKGLIEQAEDGTLFLDEIGDLSMESQVKLLRLLQESQYYPLGSDVARLSSARIVVATHREIRTMQASSGFRQDLYYRLKSHHIALPPLRERKSDLPSLVDHFIGKAAAELGKKRPTVPKELYTLLGTYSFPGNVRELEGIIFDAVSLHSAGILSLESIRQKLQDQGEERRSETGGVEEDVVMFPGRFPTLHEAEERVIAEALRRAEGNQTIAAELLGISRRALNNRLRRSEGDTGA